MQNLPEMAHSLSSLTFFVPIACCMVGLTYFAIGKNLNNILWVLKWLTYIIVGSAAALILLTFVLVQASSPINGFGVGLWVVYAVPVLLLVHLFCGGITWFLGYCTKKQASRKKSSTGTNGRGRFFRKKV